MSSRPASCGTDPVQVDECAGVVGVYGEKAAVTGDSVG
jgi:hypothetical protein